MVQEWRREYKILSCNSEGKKGKVRNKKIHNVKGVWLESQEDISEASIRFHQNQFLKKDDTEDFTMLDVLPRVVTKTQNTELKRVSIIEEVRGAVIELNKNSAGGLDGMT